MSERIVIIGGGISGITTGVLLQSLGYDTEIYAEQLVGLGENNDPRFASNYPAASVIPHSVHSDRLATLFTDSLTIFETLFDRGFPGMEMHRHYEIFEFPVEEPGYAGHLKKYTPIGETVDSMIPKRQGIDNVFGWAFDCYITEWPVYIKQLYKFYKEKGGVIYHKKIERDAIGELSSSIIINCGGVWSRSLFEDKTQPKIARGHIIHAPDMPKVRDADGRICSYNYTAQASVYSTPSGEPCDVYFYPIGNKWLMGGSRQVGTLDADGKWTGKGTDDTILVDGIEIPKQIIALNGEILENTYRKKIQSLKDLKSFIGYRFERGDEKNSLRLERVEDYGKTIIHNYGHGGAGVTLSWGCALHIARLLNKKVSLKRLLNEFE